MFAMMDDHRPNCPNGAEKAYVDMGTYNWSPDA